MTPPTSVQTVTADPMLSEANIITGAMAIARSRGHDPDEPAPLTEMCTEDNAPVPWWMVFMEESEACLEAVAATLTSSLTAAEARLGELTEALKPFAKTGWMTGEIEHTARTVVAHMHPEQEYETVLSSDDFKRARDLLAALSQTEEGPR